jgi:hypothetical protein
VVPLFLILAILLWFMNQSMDQDRIRNQVDVRGGKLLEHKLLSSAKEWWRQALERDYEVRYIDAEGHEHFATCTTGLFKGLVWTDDRLLRYADQVEGTPLPGKTAVKPDSPDAANQQNQQAKRP